MLSAAQCSKSNQRANGSTAARAGVRSEELRRYRRLAALSAYPASVVAMAHLFQKVAVPGVCVA
jgi:hypothetical protein